MLLRHQCFRPVWNAAISIPGSTRSRGCALWCSVGSSQCKRRLGLSMNIACLYMSRSLRHDVPFSRNPQIPRESPNDLEFKRAIVAIGAQVITIQVSFTEIINDEIGTRGQLQSLSVSSVQGTKRPLSVKPSIRSCLSGWIHYWHSHGINYGVVFGEFHRALKVVDETIRLYEQFDASNERGFLNKSPISEGC